MAKIKKRSCDLETWPALCLYLLSLSLSPLSVATPFASGCSDCRLMRCQLPAFWSKSMCVRMCGIHTVVSYSITSFGVPKQRYWILGVPGAAPSRTKMVLRSLRSMKWASQAGYCFLGRSIRITGPSVFGVGRGAGVLKPAGGRTWKTSAPSPAASWSPTPLVLCSVLGGLLTTSGGGAEVVVERQASDTAFLSTEPHPRWATVTGPSGCSRQ